MKNFSGYIHGASKIQMAQQRLSILGSAGLEGLEVREKLTHHIGGDFDEDQKFQRVRNHGLTVKNQVPLIRNKAKCRNEGKILVYWYIDSARSKEGFNHLLADLKPGDPVIVSSTAPKRLIKAIKDKGGELKFAVEGNSTVSSKTRSASIKKAKKRQKSNNQYSGGKPVFGYQVENGVLVENPVEQRAIQRMLELKRTGKSSRIIAKEIEAELGVEVTHKTVCKILKKN